MSELVGADGTDRSRPKAPVGARAWARACWLGLVSGAADAAGWIGSGVFAAHMTGNTALFGVSLLAGHWRLAAIRFGAVACFAAGLLLAAAIGQGFRNGKRAAIVLAGAVALLAALVPGRYAPVLLLGTALALQNATLRQFAGKAVNTSFLTGDLQQLASALARRRWNRNDEGDRVVLRIVPSIWLCYVAGAASGAALTHATGAPLLPISLAIPVVLLMLGDDARG